MKITLSENLKENFQYSGNDGDDRYPALVAIQKPLDPSLLSILTVAANASASAAPVAPSLSTAAAALLRRRWPQPAAAVLANVA